METLLQVENLNVTFRTEDEIIYAAREVSFSVGRGRTLGIVGESGSGKSASCQAIMGLTPGNGVTQADRIVFDGTDINTLAESKLEKIRGRDMAMVFQDPMTSLNPVHTIGRQIAESLRLHRGMNREAARVEAQNLLDLVGIPEPVQRLKEYPHQLSGGMCQRAMIAMALACRPSLLFADEPTTALDVTVQAQILDLMKRLQGEFGMSIVLVTHDLGVIAEMADDVTVMRYGQVVEAGPVGRIFGNPQHEYTRELLDRIPRLDRPSPVYEPPSREQVA
ncbi:MAG: ABC transporter ATP-binding protein [Rhodospirillaceae bacterium]|jgi:ABC-type dipeptide/oligopeptide/nickel transport system ATPase component|nr:ABC transporter ATP-binding protein [Rhodospirillales bacterium]MBT6406636.1 ABC transporter ATP-binding protein [Rhodospirillaceae bacterium]